MAGLTRRLVTIVAAASLAAASLLPASAAMAQGPVTVTWWHSLGGPNQHVIWEIADTFNAAQDRVRVDARYVPREVILQELLPAYEAGTGPTLVALSVGDIPRVASQGAWADLGPFLDGGAIDVTQVIPVLVEAGQHEGAQVGVPMLWFPTLFYWNKDIFRVHGLDPDHPPSTWDELEAAARATTATDHESGARQWGFPLPTYGSLPAWAMLMWQNGGGVLSEDGQAVLLDAPESVEAIERWTALVRDEGISPIGIVDVDADSMFLSGRVAMTWGGPWLVPALAQAGFDWGLGQVQEGPAGRAAALGAVQLLVDAGASAEEQAAAAELIAHWTSAEAQRRWSEGSGLPPVRTDVTSADPHVAVFLESAAHSRVHLPGIAQRDVITEDILLATIRRILAGEVGAEEGLGEAADNLRALLGIG
jgi:multiple sugar transport system substrate-binding protein